jgi:hypothetical protein
MSGLTGENPFQRFQRVSDQRAEKQALQSNPLEWVLVCEPWNSFHGGWRLTRTDVKPSTIDRGLCILLGPWRAKYSPSPTARSIPLIPFLENAGFV